MTLPGVRGRLTPDYPLGKDSWFRCGGSVDVLFEPADLDDLSEFLKSFDDPVMVLGGLANTIIRDGGIRGCVIRLGKAFSAIEVSGTKIRVGAGALNGSVASAAAKNGIGGLEFLSGIPGSVGGALRMNAGAYGAEVKDVLVEAEAINHNARIHKLIPDNMGMTYRHIDVPDDYIFTGATFEGLEEKFNNIFKKRIKRDSYFKIKSGIFGTKEEIDSSLFGDNQEDKELEQTKALIEEQKKKEQARKKNFLNYRKNSITNLEKSSFLFEDSYLNFLKKSNRYEFELIDYQFLNGEFVYKITFAPKRKEDYKGTLYINTDDFAIVRLDYENVKALRNFRLLGISFNEYLRKGTFIYSKNILFYLTTIFLKSLLPTFKIFTSSSPKISFCKSSTETSSILTPLCFIFLLASPPLSAIFSSIKISTSTSGTWKFQIY